MKMRDCNSIEHTLVKVMLILVSILLSGCGGSYARADLTTRIRGLGWGEHEMVLSVPAEFYSGALLDKLPNFSLLTGVDVQDYHSEGQQGVYVTQHFYRLGVLTGVPKKAHFLNRYYPGDPVAFQASWHQGFFTRDLEVRIIINMADCDDLLALLGGEVATFLKTTYTLDMPGKIIQHNGRLLDEHTATWSLDVSTSQTLEATARVVDVPLILSTAFTLLSAGFALYGFFGERSSTSGNKGYVARTRRQYPRRPSSRALRPPDRRQ